MSEAEYVQTINAMQTEIIELKLELGAVISQMRGDCDYCKHNGAFLDVPCKGCVWFAAQEFIEGDHWEWCGLK